MWEEILAFVGQFIATKEGARIAATALHTIASVLEQEADNLDTVSTDGTPAPAPTDGTTPTPLTAFRSMPRP